MEERLRILLIEDSSADAFLLQESLAQVDRPPEVIHVERLEEALDYLKDKTADAILLDLALPDSEGLTTLERANAAAEYLPIIILTGLEDEAVGTEAVRKGAQDYLLKGQTGARQLMQTIHRAIERKRLEQALAQSAQRNLLLAEVSAKVVAQTSLEGLLTTVVEAARNLTSARISCAGAVYEKGSFRCHKFFNAERTGCSAFQEGCLKDSFYIRLIGAHESIRFSDEELQHRAAQAAMPATNCVLRGFMGAKLVDVRGCTVGSIIVSDKEGGEDFSQEDETLLRQLALITSLALQHIESRTAAEAASIAKSQFLANMSHELRTPMNAILGMTDLALGEIIPPMVRDYLQTARESAGLLLEFLNDILDLSRLEAGRFDLDSTLFSLHKAVEQVVKTLRVRAREKGLVLICDLPSRVPDMLIGDPLRFRQILMNLVDNAIKFTHAGKVVVQANVIDQTEEVATLSFTVSDTGIGISPEDQERVFLAFTQADASTTRNYGGSGLGLTIVRRLVELMGGQIRIESQVNQGSTFRFTIRLKIPKGKEAVEPAPVRFSPTRVARRVLRVLLAEDTPTNQKLAEYLLSKRGHIVEIAQDGRQALELMEKHDYDVVLMDVQMPIMDGFQATAAIRRLADPAKAGVPIIAMTAHALKEDADRCLAAGMDAYVSKPIEADEFIELVEFLGEADMGEEERARGAELTEYESSRVASGLEERTPQASGAADGTIPAFNMKEAVNKCFGKYDFFLDMVGGFFEEVDDALQAMLASRSRGDSEELRRIAHRLKNTVLYLGARSTTDAISGVESAAKSGEAAALDQAMEVLDRRLAELKLELAPYRNQNAETFNSPG
jgi:signal transduction histidine kinase/CheY-like chemotaxis protein